jgi:hypothetical protein
MFALPKSVLGVLKLPRWTEAPERAPAHSSRDGRPQGSPPRRTDCHTRTDGDSMNIFNISSYFKRVDQSAKPVAEDWESLRNSARSSSERAEIDAIFRRPPFVV